MFNEPRNWKWMVPAMFVPVFGTVATWMVEQAELWMQIIGVVTGMWAVICLVSAIMNCWAYFSEIAINEFAETQRARATTELVMLSENMKALHPSAVNVLAMFGRATWQVIPGSLPDVDPIYVLYPTQVTYEFIAEFLRESNGQFCPAEWKFTNDGAKHYAPEGLKEGWCTDREQYQQLITYLQRRLMVTMPYGNQPAAYLGAWNPKMVAKVMNISLDEKDEESEAFNG